MRKIVLFIGLLIGVNSIASPNSVKVMVWNIWRGGVHKPGEFVLEDCRPTIKNIIEKAEADVILMVETYGSEKYFAEQLGYQYSLLSSNLCIFSKYPINKTFVFPEKISTFNFGGVEIEVSPTKKLALFNTWLHYLPDTRKAPLSLGSDSIVAWEKKGSRDDEIKTIMDILSDFVDYSDKVPVIMGGDFNSHSHLDWTENTKHLYNHGGQIVPWPVSTTILEHGFKDSYREIHPNPENNLGITWIAGHRIDEQGVDHLEFFRQDRIDYIYYQGSKLKVKNSYSLISVEGKPFKFKGEEYIFPSDHGFVLTEFSYE